MVMTTFGISVPVDRDVSVNLEGVYGIVARRDCDSTVSVKF